MKILVSLLLVIALCATQCTGQTYQGHVVFRAFFVNTSHANFPDAPFEGNATLVQTIAGGVSNTTVTLMLRGLQPNKTYGVHVHQWGDLSGSFDPFHMPLTSYHNVSTVPTVGGHFNPFNQPHNCAPNASRHAGDLGNVFVPEGTAASDWVTYTLTSELLDLGQDASLINSIIGRAIVVHENPDLCMPTGLGSWVGVGVIGIDNVGSNSASQDATLPVDPVTGSPKANAIIYNITGAIAGNVWFWSGVSGEVHMSGSVSGFEPNSVHGVHIHQFGNVNNDQSIGGHFGDSTTTHALPPNTTRHWGDLGNLKANSEGVILFTDITTGLELISLADLSRHSIIGRSIAFHQNADNGETTSYGPRYHFGVIGLAAPTATPPVFPASPNSVGAYAHAVLRPYYNSSNANVADAPIAGTVDFEQSAEGGDVTVTINVSGLQAGKSYGIHVHTWGDLSGAIDPVTGQIRRDTGSITSVGGHFDALGRTANDFHGCFGNPNRHTGDVGNITIPANATATTVTTITLTSELLDLGIRDNLLNDSIIGRAVVIHENPDVCYVPQGGLGSWIAVGVIGLSNVAGNSAKQDTLPQNIKANVLVFNATTKAPIGDIQLSTDANGLIRAYGVVRGFAPNSVHGMHVHVWGNEDTATTSGPHYSQYLSDFGHALPPNASRHWGDLGNVTADENGLIIFNNVDINANLLSLWNPAAHGIIGRTLTFHAFADDGTPTSYMGRVGYGLIGIANPATVLPAVPTSAVPTTAAPTGTTNTTLPPTTTSPPTTPTNATASPTTPSPTTNTSSSTGNNNPPSAATHNQVNLVMIIAMVMAVMLL